MAATYWHQLYQIEAVLEDAVAAELEARDVPSAIEHGSAELAQMPRALVSVTVRQADEPYAMVNGSPCLKRWSGQCEVTIYTRRSEENSRYTHAERVGIVRWLMQDLAALNTRMPFHELAYVLEKGTQRSIDAEQDADASMLSFDFGLAIKDSAWPDPET